MSFKRKVRNLIVKLLPKGVMAHINEQFRNGGYLHFSQEGEDILLDRYFNYKKEGFYIDIGAHHPTRFSNTFLFYQRGWRGINIDAMPGSMKPFQELRPKDINIECPISNQEEELTFYIFNEPALNTFSKEEAEKKDGLRNYKVVDTPILKALPLAKVLQQNLPKSQAIDFMSIDVEGLDYQVLTSNDWSLYRPKIVLIEDLGKTLEGIEQSKVYKYLKELNYVLVSKTYNTLFFKDNTTD